MGRERVPRSLKETWCTSLFFVKHSRLHDISLQKKNVLCEVDSVVTVLLKYIYCSYNINSVEGGVSNTTMLWYSEGVMTLELFSPRQWDSIKLWPHLISRKLFTAGFSHPLNTRDLGLSLRRKAGWQQILEAESLEALGEVLILVPVLTVGTDQCGCLNHCSDRFILCVAEEYCK